MYERFYGFRERPFELTSNPRYLVMTEGHREALSNLEYAIAGRKGITLLLGEAGSGKTTVIRTALEQQTSFVHSVHINNPALTRDEFIEMLAVRFELTERARASKAVFLIEFEELLRKRHAAGESTLLVIDEAQSLSFELLEELRLLANIETNEQKLLLLVIAGQPELAGRLDDPSLRQLKQRVALRCELRPLTLPETLAYISGRIRAAGGVAPQIFTREAVALLHERSGGIPRAINVIADNALLTGFGRGVSPVTRTIVDEVARDFHVGGVAAVLGVETPSAPAAVTERPKDAGAAAAPPAGMPTLSPAPSAAPAGNTPRPGGTEGAVAASPLTTIEPPASQPSSAPTAAPEPIAPPADTATSSLFRTFATTRRRFSLLSRRGIA